MQFEAPLDTMQALHGVFAIDLDHDDVAMHRRTCAVDYQYGAILDAGILHGVAGGADHEGRGFVMDQTTIEVDAGLHVVGSRRRKTRWDAALNEW